MSEHKWCEPDYYPSKAGETWLCPECGTKYRSFEVRAEDPEGSPWLSHVPEGTFGWTNRA